MRVATVADDVSGVTVPRRLISTASAHSPLMVTRLVRLSPETTGWPASGAASYVASTRARKVTVALAPGVVLLAGNCQAMVVCPAPGLLGVTLTGARLALPST